MIRSYGPVQGGTAPCLARRPRPRLASARPNQAGARGAPGHDPTRSDPIPGPGPRLQGVRCWGGPSSSPIPRGPGWLGRRLPACAPRPRPLPLRLRRPGRLGRLGRRGLRGPRPGAGGGGGGRGLAAGPGGWLGPRVHSLARSPARRSLARSKRAPPAEAAAAGQGPSAAGRGASSPHSPRRNTHTHSLTHTQEINTASRDAARPIRRRRAARAGGRGRRRAYGGRGLRARAWRGGGEMGRGRAAGARVRVRVPTRRPWPLGPACGDPHCAAPPPPRVLPPSPRPAAPPGSTFGGLGGPPKPLPFLHASGPLGACRGSWDGKGCEHHLTVSGFGAQARCPPAGPIASLCSSSRPWHRVSTGFPPGLSFPAVRALHGRGHGEERSPSGTENILVLEGSSTP